MRIDPRQVLGAKKSQETPGLGCPEISSSHGSPPRASAPIGGSLQISPLPDLPATSTGTPQSGPAAAPTEAPPPPGLLEAREQLHDALGRRSPSLGTFREPIKFNGGECDNSLGLCVIRSFFYSQGVTLEGQHENTDSHLVHENHGQPHLNISGLSDVASLARIEGTMDKEGQCLTEDIFNRMDEEHLACSERPEQNREAHNQKYEFPYHSPGCPSMGQVGNHQIMPVFEGFIILTDDEKSFSDDGDIFEKLDVQSGITEHASVQNLPSKSSSVRTPLSPFSTAYKLHKAPNLYKSHSDCLPLSYAESAGYQKKTYTSPVRKLWDIIASKSGSSEEKRSLNPELPCISEENENADEVGDTSKEGINLDVRTSAANRKPLADITEDPNCPASVSDTENEMTRCSLDSIRTEISFAGTHRKAKQKPGKRESSKMHRANDSTTMPKGLNAGKRPVEVPNNRFSKQKTSLRKGDNIVSHLTSFLSLVQQKQTVAPFTEKRDIKVRALEAAGAAKRQAEKKEIELLMVAWTSHVFRDNMFQKRGESGNELGKNETLETEKRGAFPERILENEAELDQGLGSKPCSTERICVDGTNKAISILHKATDIGDSVSNGNQERSYEISPYKCSDDEDEDEDEDNTPNDKFVPSWTSRMAQAISSQQRVDPDVILPPDSFCSISEVSCLGSFS
ncbi:hypothetical protein NL676_035213 [Syzygium grande]|nr:hypothetical protein NL676_035213 [Syzygium grande]